MSSIPRAAAPKGSLAASEKPEPSHRHLRCRHDPPAVAATPRSSADRQKPSHKPPEAPTVPGKAQHHHPEQRAQSEGRSLLPAGRMAAAPNLRSSAAAKREGRKEGRKNGRQRQSDGPCPRPSGCGPHHSVRLPLTPCAGALAAGRSPGNVHFPWTPPSTSTPAFSSSRAQMKRPGSSPGLPQLSLRRSAVASASSRVAYRKRHIHPLG